MPTSDTPKGIGLSEAKAQIEALIDPDDGQVDEGDEDYAGDGSADLDEDSAQTGETEGEGEEAEDGEADEGDEEQPGDAQLYTVKVDGEEVQVTLDELTKGYSRQADYTRKSQALAEERNAFAAERQELNKERAQYSTLLVALRQQTMEALGEEPNWDLLFQQNPVEATRIKYQWDRQVSAAQERLAAIEGEQRRLAETADRETREQLQRHMLAQKELIPQVIPEWKDAERAKREGAEIKAWAMSNGITEDQINGIDSAAVIGLLRKAWLFDKGRTRAATAKPATTQTLRPGTTTQERRPVGEATRLKQRLAKTGRVRDAAAVIERLL